MAVRSPAPDTAPVPFAPVPVAPRRDGWTAERQRAFIHVLATTGCVTEAAAAVGMNARSAYHLRQRADGEAFDRAWDVALGGVDTYRNHRTIAASVMTAR